MKRSRLAIGGLCALAAVVLGSRAGASDVEMEPQEAMGASEMASETASEMDKGWVERATFTTAVVDREPQDSVDALTNDHVQVYFFTELRSLEGQKLVHRWEYDGKVMAEVPLNVAGPRWRTYSSKRLEPSWLGEWKVSVVDASGRVLSSRSMKLQEAGELASETGDAPAAMPAAPAP